MVTDLPPLIEPFEDNDNHDTSVAGTKDFTDDVLQHEDGAQDGEALREQYQSLHIEKQKVVELLESERLKNTQLENQLAIGNYIRS